MRVLLERFKLDSRTQRFLLHHLLIQQGKTSVLEQLDQAADRQKQARTKLSRYAIRARNSAPSRCSTCCSTRRSAA